MRGSFDQLEQRLPPGSHSWALHLMNVVANAWCKAGSAFTRMVRNFSIVNGFPSWPIRVCPNRTGPVDDILSSTAISRKTGVRTTSSVRLPTTSSARFNGYPARRRTSPEHWSAIMAGRDCSVPVEFSAYRLTADRAARERLGIHALGQLQANQSLSVGAGDVGHDGAEHG